MPDLELNNSNSSYCEVCGHMHINESKICPIKEKSIAPHKVCAKCGSRIVSPEHKFCSKCGCGDFKNVFCQTSISFLMDLIKVISKVVITVPLVVFAIFTLPLMLAGQPYSALCFKFVEKLWSSNQKYDS